MRFVFLLIFWHVIIDGWSQLSGKVSVPHAGVEFTIPDGWIGQQTDIGYVLGSNTEAGAIFLTSHQSTSLEALRREAMNGFNEDGGTRLMIDGAPESLSERSIAGGYSGTLQGQPVKAYAVGIINPYGNGVTILAVTTPELFNDRYRQLARQIADNIRFFKAEKAPIVDEWKRALTNARLTYMDSYSSQGSGYSDKVVIDLCGAGYFRHSRNYSLGVDVGGAFGNDNSASQGSGTWNVVQDPGGNPILELRFTNGEVEEYTLQYVGEKTLLNGTRYYRTYDAACQ